MENFANHITVNLWVFDQITIFEVFVGLELYFSKEVVVVLMRPRQTSSGQFYSLIKNYSCVIWPGDLNALAGSRRIYISSTFLG